MNANRGKGTAGVGQVTPGKSGGVKKMAPGEFETELAKLHLELVRMQDWVKESAKGSPRSRAKRARTSSSVSIGDLKCLGGGADQEAR